MRDRCLAIEQIDHTVGWQRLAQRLEDTPHNVLSADVESLAGGDSSKRLYPAPGDLGFPPTKHPDLSGRGRYERMERETGLEPATLSLGSRSKGKR